MRASTARRASALLVVLGAVLVVATAAQADSRRVGDARGDPKGSNWPGPGYVWGGNSGPCSRQWVSVVTGSCGEGDYGEDQSGRLDIASISHGHRRGMLVHRLSTHRSWSLDILSRTRRGQISFYFNLDRDAAFERRLDVAVARGKPYGVMRNTATGRMLGRATGSRPSGRSVELVFRRSILAAGIRSYRWFAFAGIGCRRQYDVCGDRSPRTGTLLRHAL